MRRSLAAAMLILAVIDSAMLGGCALSVAERFSPVRGPLAETHPVPSYAARGTGVLSGHMTVSLPVDGACTGPWSLLGTQQQSFDLSADWDLIYGAGYHSAHVLGNRQFVRTTLTCTSGSVVRTELSNETNTRGHTYGVAEDDHGNVFKVSVYN
jgi:hypothetical protein